jgi:predicted MFS family arabinose efflux permease
MIPGAMWYVYLGTLVGDIAGIRQHSPTSPWVKVVIGVVAFVAIFYVTRFVRRALRQRTG